jgi:hypothetical protein
VQGPAIKELGDACALQLALQEIADDVHGVAPQVEFESNFESGSSCLSFKSNDPGAFNTGFMESSCTASPRP